MKTFDFYISEKSFLSADANWDNVQACIQGQIDNLQDILLSSTWKI